MRGIIDVLCVCPGVYSQQRRLVLDVCQHVLLRKYITYVCALLFMADICIAIEHPFKRWAQT